MTPQAEPLAWSDSVGMARQLQPLPCPGPIALLLEYSLGVQERWERRTSRRPQYYESQLNTIHNTIVI